MTMRPIHTLVSVLAGTVVAATVAVAPPTAAIGPAVDTDSPVPPTVYSQYSTFLNAPTVSVTPTWSLQATFFPENVFAESVLRDLGINARVEKRSVKVGVWNGQTCTNLQGPGRRSWSFTGPSGPLFESSLGFDADADVQIALVKGSGRNQGAFKVGDTVCVVQEITWEEAMQTPGFVYSSYVNQSPAGVASRPLVAGPQAGREYANAMPAPAVSAIDLRGNFEVSLPAVAQLRRELVNDGYAPRLRKIDIVVGRYQQGNCAPLARRDGDRGSYSLDAGLRAYETSTSWNTSGSRSGVVTLEPNAVYEFQAGDFACVYQVVAWSAPETGSNDRVRYVSNIGVTPNAAPAPIEIEADLNPSQIDPGTLGGPEIILPDFLADEDDPLLVYEGINAAEVQRAAANIRTQFEAIAGLIAAGDAGAAFNTNARSVAETIDVTRREVGTLLDIAGQPQADPQLGQQADALAQQLDDFAASLPIPVEGGPIRLGDLAQAVGFNPTRSPVAGTAGTGQVGALTMKIVAPKAIKRGKSTTVRVTVSPRTAKGVVRLALVRNTASGLKVVGAKQVALRGGKATTRVSIPRTAAKGTYTLTATLVPNTRTGSGITVQRPTRVS